MAISFIIKVITYIRNFWVFSDFFFTQRIISTWHLSPVHSTLTDIFQIIITPKLDICNNFPMCWLSLHKSRWFTIAKLILKCTSDHGISTLKTIQYSLLTFIKSNIANSPSHSRPLQYSHVFPMQPKHLSCLQPNCTIYYHWKILQASKLKAFIHSFLWAWNASSMSANRNLIHFGVILYKKPIPENQFPQHNDCFLF